MAHKANSDPTSDRGVTDLMDAYDPQDLEGPDEDREPDDPHAHQRARLEGESA